MASSTQPDLSSILTPSLFHAVLQNRLPWPKEQELDFSAVGEYIWKAKLEVQKQFFKICFPVLKILSSISLDDMPDLLQYLPEPSSKDFLDQALGLQLLLDQGPRALLKGTDARWKYDHFDIISQKLAYRLQALPEDQRPNSKASWTEELGATFGYWILARLWFQAPFVHSEDLRDHELAGVINVEGRKEVEKFTGVTDPYIADREELLKDTLAYPRWSREGPPAGHAVEMKDFAFWELLMMDVHKYIIELYGGYPQRYAARGRDATEAEKQYLIRSEHFDEIDEMSARQIREDVRLGRWTPLKGRKDLQD